MPRGSVTVDIQGMPQLRRRLQDLPDELIDACKRAIRAGAEQVKKETEEAVPVDTGRLRRTVRIRYSEGGLTADVGWWDQESYYATFVEHGTRSMPAQPSLHPALEAERPRLPRRVREEVRKAVGG